MSDKDKSFDALEMALSIADMGWHRHENHETGATAMLPTTVTDENEWEAKNIAMHAQQQPLRLKAKPQENSLARVVRGD